MLDLVRYSPQRHAFDQEFISETIENVDSYPSQDYKFRNLQARILAHLLELSIFSKEPGTVEFRKELSQRMAVLGEMMTDGDFEGFDLATRTLRFFISNIDEKDNRTQNRYSQSSSNYYNVSREVAMRSLHPILPRILPALLSAFTEEEIGVQGKE